MVGVYDRGGSTDVYVYQVLQILAFYISTATLYINSSYTYKSGSSNRCGFFRPSLVACGGDVHSSPRNCNLIFF